MTFLLLRHVYLICLRFRGISWKKKKMLLFFYSICSHSWSPDQYTEYFEREKSPSMVLPPQLEDSISEPRGGWKIIHFFLRMFSLTLHFSLFFSCILVNKMHGSLGRKLNFHLLVCLKYVCKPHRMGRKRCCRLGTKPLLNLACLNPFILLPRLRADWVSQLRYVF